ncbi:MAG: hypothetical protein Q9226_004262 [Calogaya cf. arnoldii]
MDEPSWKRRKFMDAAKNGTWKKFLNQDASMAKKAFKVWFSEVYLKTLEGISLHKTAKAQIHYLCDENPVPPTPRSKLLPSALTVLITWEDVPLVPGTPEWSTARVRLIANLLVEGLFHESQAQGLKVTGDEIAEARLWLHKKPDGTISRFEPLRQPWHFKGLHWMPKADDEGADDEGTFKTIVEVPAGEQGIELEAAEQDQDNPEALRISSQTLQQLIRTPIQSEETSTVQTSQAEVAALPQKSSDTAEQTQNEAHHLGKRPREHVAGPMDRHTEPVRAGIGRSPNVGLPDEPVMTSARYLGRAEPVPKTEPNEDENSDDPVATFIRSLGRAEPEDEGNTGTEASEAAQPAVLTKSNTDFYHSTEGSSRATLSNEARMMANPSFEASRQAHGLPSEMQIARQMSNQNNSLLEVSEDEDDDKPMNLEGIPWDWDSRYHPRFQQADHAPSEGNSSDLQYMEHITDDRSGGAGDGEQVGPTQLSGRSMSSSLHDEAGGQYTDDDYLDELQTGEEAGVNFAMQGNRSPERNAAYSFANDRRASGEGHRTTATANSEATTEILDRDDAEMAGSGIGRYEEEDKENRPVRGTSEELFLTDEDGRLEIRIIEDMDASSEDELVGNNDNTAGY